MNVNLWLWLEVWNWRCWLNISGTRIRITSSIKLLCHCMLFGLQGNETFSSNFLLVMNLIVRPWVSNNLANCIVCVVYLRSMNKERMMIGMKDAKAMCLHLKKIRCLSSIIRSLSHVLYWFFFCISDSVNRRFQIIIPLFCICALWKKMFHILFCGWR